MRHLMLGAPMVAIALTMSLFLLGAAWWVLVLSLVFAAPAVILLALVVCKTIYPCDASQRSGNQVKAFSQNG